MSNSASSSRRGSAQPVDPKALPTPEQLEAASKIEIFDKDGKKKTFGESCGGKRTVAVFIRHFWCGVCQAYVSQLGHSIQPHNLPEDVNLVVIGCGNSTPITAYIESTSSPYPIYACPSLDLHKIFEFTSKMSGSKKGEEKEYEKDLGGSVARVWTSLVAGPMKHIEHVSSVGPKGQNGGEVIIEADGKCSYIHRMQHSADHTELAYLAGIIGAEYVPQPSGRGSAVSQGRKSSNGGVEKSEGSQRQGQVTAA